MYGIQDSQREAKDIFLEHNHTHFIIVYNAENDQDLEFRIGLEEELRRQYVLTLSHNIDQVSRSLGRLGKAISEDDDFENEDEKIISNKEDNKKYIPLIHLYVDGELDMLNYCKKALLFKTPVLVFQVNG
jgi:hypothetical protein